MHKISIFVFLAAVTSLSWAAKNESLDALKMRAQNARAKDRPGLCLRIARQQVHNADKFYDNGQVEAARSAVEDVATYSEKARDAALTVHKHQKDVEIAVRKMAAKLRDVKRTANIEDQPSLENAIQRLEDIRTSLLQQMFGRHHHHDE